MYAQLVTPDPFVPCQEGMCLKYVQDAFKAPVQYGRAIDAWQAVKVPHTDQNFPAGCWVPVWFSLADNPAGHVALLSPDGSVYSTSDLDPNPLHHHPSLEDLEAYYAHYGHPLTYLGWSEDIEGVTVVAPQPEGTPRMATLDGDDLNAIHVFCNENGDRVINDLRAHIAALAETLNITPDALAQALVKQGTVTITPKVG